MKSIRRVHAWLGVLFAPSIIFFALTGSLQMFGLHESEGGGSPGIVAKMAMVHTHQTATIPQRAARGPRPEAKAAAATAADGDRGEPGAEPDRRPEAGARPAATTERPARPTTMPLKIFFLMMALSLIVSSALGLWIAFTSKRDRALHVGLLVAGVILPVVLLLV